MHLSKQGRESKMKEKSMKAMVEFWMVTFFSALYCYSKGVENEQPSAKTCDVFSRGNVFPKGEGNMSFACDKRDADPPITFSSNVDKRDDALENTVPTANRPGFLF